MSDNTVIVTTTEYFYDDLGRLIKTIETEVETEPTSTLAEDKSKVPPYVPWRQGGSVQTVRPGDYYLWNFGDGLDRSFLSTVEQAEQRTDEEDGVIYRFPTGVKVTSEDLLIGPEGIQIGGFYL